MTTQRYRGGHLSHSQTTDANGSRVYVSGLGDSPLLTTGLESDQPAYIHKVLAMGNLVGAILTTAIFLDMETLMTRTHFIARSVGR